MSNKDKLIEQAFGEMLLTDEKRKELDELVSAGVMRERKEYTVDEIRAFKDLHKYEDILSTESFLQRHAN